MRLETFYESVIIGMMAAGCVGITKELFGDPQYDGKGLYIIFMMMVFACIMVLGSYKALIKRKEWTSK